MTADIDIIKGDHVFCIFGGRFGLTSFEKIRQGDIFQQIADTTLFKALGNGYQHDGKWYVLCMKLKYSIGWSSRCRTLVLSPTETEFFDRIST